jgi:hypothetical protein
MAAGRSKVPAAELEVDMVGASGAGPTVTRSGPLPARATFTGMRHRRIIIPSVIALVVALAVTGAVVLNGRRSEFARVAAARIPAFPGVTDCSPYDGAGEVRLDQVFITVLAMLRLKFDTDPARSWFGKVPVSTREDEIKDHYASAMPSVLRPDNDFPDLGIDHRLWVVLRRVVRQPRGSRRLHRVPVQRRGDEGAAAGRRLQVADGHRHHAVGQAGRRARPALRAVVL